MAVLLLLKGATAILYLALPLGFPTPRERAAALPRPRGREDGGWSKALAPPAPAS